MSKENLDQFMNQVADSEELQARIGEEIDAETLIALGAEHGCEFSADDLTAGAELSDEELDGVAGGAGFIKFDGIARSGSKFRIGRKHAPDNGFTHHANIDK